MDRDLQRLNREVYDSWRDEVARAASADARYRPRDDLVKVRAIGAPFRVSGREVQSGEIVEVEKWLMMSLLATAQVERV
jgi:hypothetical protein